MRCFAFAKSVLSCVFLSTLLGIPAVLQAADTNAAQPPASTPSEAAKAVSVSQAYGDLPLSFEANQGQVDRQVRFLSRGNGYAFFLTSTEAVLSFPGDGKTEPVTLHMKLEGANSAPQIRGVDQLPGTSNYFVGGNPAQWRTGVATYAKVAYENIYPGVNLVYYGNQRHLEYDFVLAPGADPNAIRLAIHGAGSLSVDAAGNLILQSSGKDVSLLAPRIYQDSSNGQKREVEGRWTLAGNIASFQVAVYDRSKALVIDPVLTYSSFLGGSQKNSLNRIVVDAAGNTYVAGFTSQGDFPAAPTPQAMTFGGGTPLQGAFVAKIDPTGSNLIYSTYLSGSGGGEATGLAVDAKGNVYVAGYTQSSDFPVRNAFQPTCAASATGGCHDAFLTKISPTGDSLVYSTYLGGTGVDSATGLAVDTKGSAYVVGITSSTDFPTTAGVLQNKCAGACTQNVFVTKFDPTGAKLSYSTYLGGSGSDSAAGIALDGSGSAYIAGTTTSADFPLAVAFQKACTLDPTTSSACLGMAFATKLKADGSALVYSTYLGGSLGSTGSAIAADSQGNAYVTGSTQSSDFPVVKAFQKSCGIDAASGKCSIDGFLTKLAPSGGTLVYSTYLGGSGHDEVSAVAVDAAGKAYVAGFTESANFPTAKPLQAHLKGASDAFVARFNAAGSSLEFSTYHGGDSTETATSIAVDMKGNFYVAGQTSSTDFPTLHPFQSSCAGSCTNAFVSEITPDVAPTFTSAASTSFLGGIASTFTVTTSGTAPITLTENGTLPGTVTFVDNGDGTGTLAGTPPNTASTNNFTLSASNSDGSIQQNFTLSICPGSISGLPSLTAVNADGTSGTFSVTMTGSCAWTTSADSAWLTITGGGTGSGSGTVSVGNFTNAGSATSRTGNFIIVGAPQPVTQNAVLVAVAQVGGTGPVEVGQTANFQATVTNVGTANQGVTWTLTQSGTPCSPTCGTLNSATANPVTYTAPASTDPASAPSGVTITATSTFDTTKSGGAGITVTDYTVAIAPTSATISQGQTVTPAPTITGAAYNHDGYTGTLAFSCSVTPASANAPTCNAGGITIPGSPTTSATIATTASTPTNTYTVTFTATDGKAVSHKATFTVTVSPAPVLAVTKTTSTTFSQGGTGTWNIAVSNTQTGSTTSGTLTVTDVLASGYTLKSFSGTNWTCTGTASVTCTDSTDTIAGGASYPTLSLTVNIPASSPTSVSNTATASGGGATASASGSDTNVPVTQVPANLTITSGNNQSVPVGNNFVAFTATVTDAGSVAISGVPVTFTAPSSGASCSFSGSTTSTVNSNSSGVATSGICTANSTNGTYNVQASVSASGVTKPNYSTTNTDFSLAFSPTSIDVPPGTAPAGVTLTAKALSGYTPTSLTVASCNVAPTTPPTCSIGSPITVGTPATVTLSSGSTAASYTVTATVHDNSTVPVTHTATFTINVVQVTITTTSPTTLEVNQTFGFSGSTAGLSDNTVNWSVVGTGCTGSACGTVSPTGPNTGTTYSSPSSTSSGVQVSIKATSNGDANFSAQSLIFPITDYSIALAAAPVVITQNSSGTTGLASTVTATAINGYVGAINASNCSVTPSPAGAPTCSAAAPAVPGTSSVSVVTQPNTPVGIYSMAVSDTDQAANPQTRTTGSQLIGVECNYSMGVATPVFTPTTNSTTATPNTYSVFMNEVVGGNACPYGNLAVVGGANIPNATGDNAVATLLSGQNGTLTSSSPSLPLTFQVIPATGSAQSGSVTSSYFQVPQSGTNFVASSSIPVGLEATVPQTAGSGTTTVTLPVTLFTSGTLNIANIGASSTACGVVDSNLLADPNNANFGITCTAAPTTTLGAGTTVALQVTVSSSSASLLRPHDRRPGMFYAFGLGLPAIVFLGIGASSFAPKGMRRKLSRGTTALGILAVLWVLVLLPACGGGFNAVGTTQTTNADFTVTVMGSVTNSSGNVTGVEIFTVPLTAAK